MNLEFLSRTSISHGNSDVICISQRPDPNVMFRCHFRPCAFDGQRLREPVDPGPSEWFCPVADPDGVPHCGAVPGPEPRHDVQGPLQEFLHRDPQHSPRRVQRSISRRQAARVSSAVGLKIEGYFSIIPIPDGLNK